MRNQIINLVEAKYRKDIPEFRVGQTVSVNVRIKEGEKERVQAFTGVVIARKGGGLGETFTVRRIVANQGVERTFLVHSPFIANIDVTRTGKVRRAKLYFLRDRIGKARKLREKRITQASRAASSRARSKAKAEESDEQRELATVES